jgi:probable rRNA maturation factor
MRLAVHRAVRCRLPVGRLRRLCRTALRRYGRGRAASGDEVSLAIVGARAMRTLNRSCRGEDQPTDVLSFEYGEVVICWPRALRQAQAHGVSRADEAALLFAHGLLHTFGFDHRRPPERSRMRRAEEALLGFPGLVERAHGNAKRQTRSL